MYFNFSFCSLLGIPIEIKSSAIGLKICVITAGVISIIKSINKSIIKKKKKKHNEIILLVKSKLNRIEVLFLRLESIEI